MKKHYNIKIQGIVQGVGFRSSVKETAKDLDLKGFVRNDADGTVRIEAEGDEGKLDFLLAWCKNGTKWSEIKKIENIESELKGFEEFKIKM